MKTPNWNPIAVLKLSKVECIEIYCGAQCSAVYEIVGPEKHWLEAIKERVVGHLMPNVNPIIGSISTNSIFNLDSSLNQWHFACCSS